LVLNQIDPVNVPGPGLAKEVAVETYLELA
jgi:hypothetical protein